MATKKAPKKNGAAPTKGAAPAPKKNTAAPAPAPAPKMSPEDKAVIERIQKEFIAHDKLTERDLIPIFRRKVGDDVPEGKDALIIGILLKGYGKANVMKWQDTLKAKPAPAPAKVDPVALVNKEAAKAGIKPGKKEEKIPPKPVHKQETPAVVGKTAAQKAAIAEHDAQVAKNAKELEPILNGNSKPAKPSKKEEVATGAAPGKDHTYVKFDSRGVAHPISDEEGKALMKKALSAGKIKEIVNDCPCYGCEKNEGKCPKVCKGECKLPPCKHLDYCATRYESLGLPAPQTEESAKKAAEKKTPAKKSNGTAGKKTKEPSKPVVKKGTKVTTGKNPAKKASKK